MTRVIDLPFLADYNIYKLWQRINELESMLKFECAHCHQVSRAYFGDGDAAVIQNGNRLYCEHCDQPTLAVMVPYSEDIQIRISQVKKE